MNIRDIRTGRLAGLCLALLLCFGGCENPANEGGSEGNTSNNAAREAAENFYAAHRAVFDLRADSLTLGSGEVIEAALAAYQALTVEVKALLKEEKAHLDVLKIKLDGLKGAAAENIFYAAADLRAWLAEQPDNTPETPYAVAYYGTETANAVYNAIDSGEGGRYVALDLSKSGVGGFECGNEPGRQWIVSLILPDSLTSISTLTASTRPSIFENFSNLKTLNAAGLVTLGNYALQGCINLTSVSLPKVTAVGSSVFLGCTGLTSISLPEATSIGNNAFNGCTGLTSVSLPQITAIGNNAFTDCTGLTSVSLPQVTAIGNNAFTDCTSLTTVILPKAASIGNTAFQNCNSLTSVTLGTVPPTIGTRIFQGAAADDTTTITFKVPQNTLYTVSPWNDKMGNSSVWNSYWDNTATKGNLTVALAQL